MHKTIIMNNPIYKAATKKILASSYNISVKTFNKWLIPINSALGEQTTNIFTPNQVKKIVEFLGEPEHINLIRV